MDSLSNYRIERLSGWAGRSVIGSGQQFRQAVRSLCRCSGESNLLCLLCFLRTYAALGFAHHPLPGVQHSLFANDAEFPANCDGGETWRQAQSRSVHACGAPFSATYDLYSLFSGFYRDEFAESLTSDSLLWGYFPIGPFVCGLPEPVPKADPRKKIKFFTFGLDQASSSLVLSSPRLAPAYDAICKSC